MTAKEALRERVEGMSEDEAAELLDRLEWESTEFDLLSEEELADLAEAEAEVSRGELRPLEDLLPRFRS